MAGKPKTGKVFGRGLGSLAASGPAVWELSVAHDEVLACFVRCPGERRGGSWPPASKRAGGARPPFRFQGPGTLWCGKELA